MSVSLTPNAVAALLGEGWRRPGESAHGLAEALRAIVVDGRVAVRTRVPSERTLAEALQLSRGSVSRAYDRLREEGYLASRRGAGSWLTLPGDPAPPELPTPGTLDPDRVLDLTIAALPAPDAHLAEAAARAAQALPRHAHAHGYLPAGLPALREAIAHRLTERGLPTTPDEVLVTAGAQHGLHLLLALLVAPGDRVLVDAPCYPRSLAAIRSARARAVPVPLDRAGWDPEAWAAALRDAAPRLALTIPDFHNPTGLTMTAAARAALASACARSGTILVADETCAELRLDGPAMPAPLAAHAPVPGAVVTVGTTSKAVWGGLRIGWIRATPQLVRELAARRAEMDMASPVLEQLVAVELLERWDEVVATRRALLAPRRDALLDGLHEHAPGWDVRRPHGGLSTWIRLPAPVATRLAAAATRDGVHVTPGPSFSADGTFERHLRIPFTLPPDDLRTAVVRLAALAERLGASTAPAGEPVALAV